MKIISIVTISSLVLFSSLLFGQSKYRTFTQEQFSEKTERRMGRGIASDVSFVVKNNSSEVKNLVSAHFSSQVVALKDSGGFPYIRLANKNSTLIAEGKDLQPGDSIVFNAVLKRQVPGSKITGYQMRYIDTATSTLARLKSRQAMMPGSGVSTFTVTHGSISPIIKPQLDRPVIAQPTGGNIRDIIYQKFVKKPTGIVLGIPQGKGKWTIGWERSSRGDIQIFPHAGTPRCFDSVYVSTKAKPFNGELKNLPVWRHDNHLLGSLHAMKLSILANTAKMTEPTDIDATPLGWLLFNTDETDGTEQFNGMTLNEMCHLADSALTYCSNFSPEFYVAIDAALSRVLDAFSGPIETTSMKPLQIEGTKSLDEVSFLRANPAAASLARHEQEELLASLPKKNSLLENYPNPFNPSTVIGYTLSTQSMVTLKVYNMLGQEVAILLNNEITDEGEHQVEFDATNLSSGTYYYRLSARTGDHGMVFSDLKKMVLIK